MRDRGLALLGILLGGLVASCGPNVAEDKVRGGPTLLRVALAAGTGPESVLQVLPHASAESDLQTSQQALRASLGYSVVQGGVSEVIYSYDVAVDPSGNAYIVGIEGLYPNRNGFITKYSPSGQQMYRLPFNADPSRVVTDPNGGVYMTGSSSSGGFVAKVNSSGTDFIYSRGLQNWSPTDIAVDAYGRAYLLASVPSASGTQGTQAGILIFNSAGVPASSYVEYGGSGNESPGSIALDSSADVVVSGTTRSSDLPLWYPLQASLRGTTDGFLAVLDPSMTYLLYGTYLGGDGDDGAYGVGVDAAFNIYVAGKASAGFPVPAGAPACAGGGFVAKIGPAGDPSYSRCFGLPGEWAGGLAVHGPSGTAYVTGFTTAADLPVTGNAYQWWRAGGEDAFILQVSPAGLLTYASYLGGSADDEAYAIAVDSASNTYVTGMTFSSDFPRTGNAVSSFMKAFTAKFLPIDTTAPTTSITAPAPGTTVSGTVTVNATATDDVGVTRVDFYDGTQLIGSDSTSPYSIDWGTTTVSPGSHVLTSMAYDAANNAGTSAGVTVTVDNTPPTCAITAPVAGASVSGTVVLSASATDNVGVTRVDFYDGTQLIGSDSTSPFSINWGTTTVSSGSHVLSCKAYDAANNAGTSAGVTVTVDNTPPTCAITAPVAGASVSGTVVVSASATDNVGVTRVDFYDGTQLIGSDGTSPFSITWGTTTVSPGSHVLTCKAYDAVNNSGTSSGVTVTVDRTPPTCAITAPTAGSTVTGTVTISASASDNVGVSRVELYVDGAVLLGTAATAPYGIAWSTGYFGSQSPGNHVLTCKAYDAANNSGTSAGVTVNVLDQQAPDVWISAPVGGAPLSGTVTVSASAWDNVGVTRVEFSVDGTQLLGTDTTSPFSITWDTSSASMGNHTLTARAYDAAGNNRTSVSVTVNVQDQAAPTVSITAPTAGSTLSGTVAVNASAADNVGVVRVECFVDGTLIGSDTTGPFSINWATAGVPAGAHVLTCRAYDAAGNSAATAGVSVTVAPQLAISFLSPGIWQDVSGTTILSASVQSNVAVAGVDYTVSPAFIEGGGDEVQFIGTTATAPFKLNWDTTQIADGPYVLHATVYGANGSSASAQTSVTVLNFPCGGGILLQSEAGPSSVICPDGLMF